MSGSAGGDRIKSREDFQQFLRSYESVIKKFPGFVSFKPSGSYNSDMSKVDFGDIDLIVHIKSDKSKADVKKDLASFFNALPDTITVPFGEGKYKGKKFLNTGEIVTIRYHDTRNGYSSQLDNMIALDSTEAHFKGSFLDLPAEKQGLVLGLVKVATIETDPSVLFKKMHISQPTQLPADCEYEFNLSSAELQLRKVQYEKGSYKQVSRDVMWTSRNFKDVENLLYQYNLNASFEDLIKQAKKKLHNPRSGARMQGVFNSMISVKSGEVGTAKGSNKEAARAKVQAIFGESKLIGFNQYILDL